MGDASPIRRVPVLVAGGGPVGLTLGHELASHGVPCLVVERNPTTTQHPKMDITNSRSMELFARLGLSIPTRSTPVPCSRTSSVPPSTPRSWWRTRGRPISWWPTATAKAGYC